MYLLLIIYSITNLNNVSWGTREVPVKKSKAEMEADKKAAEEAARQKKANSWQGKLGGALGAGGDGDTDAGISFNLGNVLSLRLFESEKPEKREIERLADTLETVNKRLEHIES